MKRYVLVFAVVALALLLAACQTGPPAVQAESRTTETTQPITQSPSGIAWVEQGERIFINENDLRWTGIEFREVDLSEPWWAGETWDISGFTAEPRSDLSQILGRRIQNRDEAAHIAIQIIESEQQDRNIFGSDMPFELSRVSHDPQKNIWIFNYQINPLVPGSDFMVAVDGASGELLRIWVY